MRTALRLALAALPILSTACLFDEKPPCRIGGDLCPVGLVCVDRVCRVPNQVDRGPAPDVQPGDGPPAPADRGPADARVDLSPDALPRDMAPTDRGPRDGPPDLDRPDRGVPDDGVPDMQPVDMNPDMGRACDPVDVCNGRDDDCDDIVDEGEGGCDIPGGCEWRHRAHHSYLFCNRVTDPASALDLCRRQLPLQPAVPDTCDESTWLWATGNTVPVPNDWMTNGRGRAWWLGLMLDVADDGSSVFRTDGIDAPLPEGGCWADGEPDETVRGETCVDLFYVQDTLSFGWNDDLCGLNAENPVTVLCEVPCDPLRDADEDGENACVDCDDTDDQANSANPARCPQPPEEGFPPGVDAAP